MKRKEGHGFLFFAKIVSKKKKKKKKGENIRKKKRRKYSQKRNDHPKQSATDALKTASKKVILKKSRSNW